MTRACDQCGGPCIPKDGRAKNKRFCRPACAKEWTAQAWRKGAKKEKPRRARGPRTPRFQVSGELAERVQRFADEQGMTSQAFLSWLVRWFETQLESASTFPGEVFALDSTTWPVDSQPAGRSVDHERNQG